MRPSVLAQYATDDLFRYYLDRLMTPEGLTVGLLLLTVPVALLVVDRLKWAVLAVLIHLATYSLGRGEMTPDSACAAGAASLFSAARGRSRAPAEE